MANDKGKAPKPASVTLEALRVLLDAIQALSFTQSPAPSVPVSSNTQSDSTAGSSNAGSSAPTSMPSSSSTNSGVINGGGLGIGANVAPMHTGFHCSACGAYNIRRPQTVWYVIMAGRQVGVFSSWSLVHPHVTGVAHACFRRYGTQAAAQRAYNDAVAAGLVCVLP